MSASADSPVSLLIVDDMMGQVEALCHVLEAEGYRTVGRTSAQQALSEIKPGRFDLLLTDLRMPEIDGISLLHAARAADGALGGIVITAHADISMAVEAMQAGALDVIEKPFTRDVILPRVSRALDVRRLRLDNAALHERERRYIQELESANRQLEAFSVSISHDLRNPVHTIAGFCKLYLSEYGMDISDGGRRLLDQVIEGTQRMEQLIEGLLRFCRASRQVPTKCPVSLDWMVRRVMTSLQTQSANRRLELRIGPLPECEADPLLLEQVFVNLLSNALKFTRHRDPAVIEVGAMERGEEWVLFVRDNGAGFDMKYVDRLFGVFQRLHPASKFEGTGVGLSIVR